MSSLFVVPELSADILEISWNGGETFIEFTLNSSSSSSTYGPPIQTANMDQVGNVVDFCVFYTQFTNGYYGSNMVFRRSIDIANQSIVGVAQVEAGDLIDPATFAGQTDRFFIANSVSHVGFLTSGGNVGWFKIDLSGGLQFREGQFGNAGETLQVGELKGDLNCDGVVNLLDIQPFVDLLGSGGYSSKGDFDDNSNLDLLDVQPFVDALAGN